MIEVIKIIEQEYNNAIRHYVNKDYVSFFKSIRIPLEKIPMVIIHDILSEENYEDFINGETENILQKTLDHEPTGKDFARYLPACYYYKMRESLGFKHKRMSDMLKLDFESFSREMNRYWGIASSLLHGDIPNCDISTQASSCQSFFPSFFDFIKNNRIVSDSLIEFFYSLDKVNSISGKENHESKKQIEELTQQVIEKNRSLLIAQQQQQQTEIELSQTKANHREEIKAKEKEISALKLILEEKLNDNQKLQEERVIAEKQRLEAENIAYAAIEEAERIKAEKASPVIATTESIEENASIVDKIVSLRDDDTKETSVNTVPLVTINHNVPNSVVKKNTFRDADHKKAFNLAMKGQTPNEIKNRYAWSPAYTYSCLTNLIEDGMLPTDPFIDRITYDIIMDSIKELGSDADNKEIRDNCEQAVTLWQVNMVLAELRSSNQIIESSYDEDEAAKEFAKNVLRCFHIERHKCFSIIPSDPDSWEPDIVIELSAYKQRRVFAIGVYFEKKKNADSITLNWDYLKGYRDYNKQIDGPVFFILGKGGKVDMPQELYILPLSLFKKNKPIFYCDIEKYRQTKTTGVYRYNINTDELNIV